VATHEIRIDRSKTLLEEPTTGHNRWHPDIPPVLRCEPGDEVVLETRDAFDGQMGPDATLDTVAAPNLDVVHPLTGPVFVQGAEPGDVLEVEILDVEPDRYGYTVQVPGFGVRLPARRLSGPVQGQLGHRRRLGDCSRAARRPHPGFPVHGHHRSHARTCVAGQDRGA
jgi:hypothetical protein